MWYSLRGIETAAGTSISAYVTVDKKSPWFAGHFPGDAILPGIAQINMVADMVGLSRRENLCIRRLSRVKFKNLVRPGERLEIRARATEAANTYKFRITSGARDVCTGTMSLTTVTP